MKRAGFDYQIDRKEKYFYKIFSYIKIKLYVCNTKEEFFESIKHKIWNFRLPKNLYGLWLCSDGVMEDIQQTIFNHVSSFEQVVEIKVF